MITEERSKFLPRIASLRITHRRPTVETVEKTEPTPTVPKGWVDAFIGANLYFPQSMLVINFTLGNAVLGSMLSRETKWSDLKTPPTDEQIEKSEESIMARALKAHKAFNIDPGVVNPTELRKVWGTAINGVDSTVEQFLGLFWSGIPGNVDRLNPAQFFLDETNRTQMEYLRRLYSAAIEGIYSDEGRKIALERKHFFMAGYQRPLLFTDENMADVVRSSIENEANRIKEETGSKIPGAFLLTSFEN